MKKFFIYLAFVLTLIFVVIVYFGLNGLVLKNVLFSQKEYSIKIEKIKITFKEINASGVKLFAEKNNVKCSLLGLKGFCDVNYVFKKIPYGLFYLKITDFDFADLIEFYEKKEQLQWVGLFEGFFSGEITKTNVSNIAGKFESKNEGLFNIKQEKAISFIKDQYRLDEQSYKSIVDNMQNYQYNSGKIILESIGDEVACKFNLQSEKKGNRNFEIVFHDFLQGIDLVQIIVGKVFIDKKRGKK